MGPVVWRTPLRFPRRRCRRSDGNPSGRGRPPLRPPHDPPERVFRWRDEHREPANDRAVGGGPAGRRDVPPAGHPRRCGSAPGGGAGRGRTRLPATPPTRAVDTPNGSGIAARDGRRAGRIRPSVTQEPPQARPAGRVPFLASGQLPGAFPARGDRGWAAAAPAPGNAWERRTWSAGRSFRQIPCPAPRTAGNATEEGTDPGTGPRIHGGLMNGGREVWTTARFRCETPS